MANGITALCLVLVAATGLVHADFMFSDFRDITGLNLVDSAAQVGSRLRLTPAAGGTGAAWFITKQSIQDGFETTFQFQITELISDGADGFAFVIQNSSVSAVGEGGGGIGYHGIANGLAVEFDTWANGEWGDPNDNHLSIHTRGRDPNSVDESASLGSTTDIPNLSDGNSHTVRILYVPGSMEVFVDNLVTPALVVAVDLAATLSLDGSQAWVGFTAATGGAAENHDLVDWSFTEGQVPTAMLVVTTTQDSGLGSLRQAILDANASEEPRRTIHFQIPTTDPGFDGQVFTIEPTSALPVIRFGTTINGTTQSTMSGDSNPFGPEIVLHGRLAGGSGLVISGDTNTVQGLVINGFPGDGIGVWSDADATPSNNRIAGNYLGTDPSGTLAVPNGTGLSIHGLASPDSPARGNVIDRNVIAGNTEVGIHLCEAAGTLIFGNRLGTDRDGIGPLGNGAHGILMTCAGAPDTTIQQNTITFNGGDGVRIDPDYGSGVALIDAGHLGTTIQRNAVFANSGLGIHLIPPTPGTDEGVTPNDACDVDEGANRLQNFPDVILAVSDGRSTTLSGTLNSVPNQPFTIELFANEAVDPSGFGEGQRFVEAITVTTDAACTSRFTLALPIALTGQFLTATATDAGGNTSEFSAARPVLATVSSCQGGSTAHIRGRVTESEAAGQPGITVTLVRVEDACQQTTTTGPFGGYDFPNLGGGTYLVIPNQAGCTFSPPSRTVGVGEGGARTDFTASCP